VLAIPSAPITDIVSNIIPVSVAIPGIYGLFVGTLCTPFLLAERVRSLYASLPGPNWGVNYALWTPIPCIVWWFLWGFLADVTGREVPLQSDAWVLGIPGLGMPSVVATAASLLWWPVVLLYALPALGVEWHEEYRTVTTAAILLAATAWYLLFVAGAIMVLDVFAGFGESFNGA